MLYKNHEHLWIEVFSDSNYAGDKRDRKSIYDYYTYIGGNLVTWRSKKQSVVSRSDAKVKYRAMAHTACDMIWLNSYYGSSDSTWIL